MTGLPFAPECPATLVVVGGHTRAVGKTATIEHILRARSGERWVAVKVSAHRHASADDSALVEEADRSTPLTQTGRYLEAGAHRAFLCRTPEARLADTAAFLRQLLADGANVIVESNRIARFVRPDVVLFVVSPSIADWKSSSGACLAAAGALVTGERAGEVAGALAAQGTRLRGRPVFEMDRDRRVHGLDHWLDSSRVLNN